MQFKNQRSGSKTACRFFFIFERNYGDLKSKRPYFLLNKNIKFNKNKTEPKMENPTHSFRKINHHGAEISVIWLVEWNAIKLLILITLLGKNKLWGPEKFQCYTTLVAFLEIHFRSLFFDTEKRRQCSEVTAIPWDLL